MKISQTPLSVVIGREDVYACLRRTKEMENETPKRCRTASRLRFVMVLKRERSKHLALHLRGEFVIVSKKALFCGLSPISSIMRAESQRLVWGSLWFCRHEKAEFILSNQIRVGGRGCIRRVRVLQMSHQLLRHGL